MARISAYNQDAELRGDDKVLGTTSGGQATRNYSLDSLVKWINRSGQMAVSRQVLFNFYEDISVSRPAGSVTFLNGGGGTFANTTELIVHKYTESAVKVDELLLYGVGKHAVIFNPYAHNEFAEFSVVLVEEWTQDNRFMRMVLTHLEGDGTWLDQSTFGISFFKDSADQHYTHLQNTTSSTWTVPHGLNKYPSVTVVDSAGTNIVGAVSYTSNNELTITFSSAFKGKAYLN